MQDTKRCIGSTYQRSESGSPGRVAVGDARATSLCPHLIIFAASLALWVMIIAACSVVIG